ncbi:MAG: hypothetical protein JWN74_3312 [Acidobacteriaceae bacterium]|nr:hypothetical protein [Acidobacteriaceae bacterium]
MEDRVASLFTDRFFLLGSLLLLVAVIETFTGTAITRGQGLIYRAKDPKTFWCLVAISYLGAIFFYAGVHV